MDREGLSEVPRGNLMADGFVDNKVEPEVDRGLVEMLGHQGSNRAMRSLDVGDRDFHAQDCTRQRFRRRELH